MEGELTTGIPARQLADALSYAAGRTATALSAGVAPDPVDLDVLAVNAAALLARTLARHPEVDWSDAAAAVTAALLNLRVEPSCDGSTGPHVPAGPVPGRLPPLEEVGRLPENLCTAPPITRYEQLAGVLGADWVAMAKEASGADGPIPAPEPSRDGSTSARWRAQAKKAAEAGSPRRMSRKKALALLDSAELVKAEHYQETGGWELKAADGTVICHLAPNYSGLRRNGWNAWPYGSTPNRHDHYPNRDKARFAGADSWLRIVTAKRS